MISKQSFPFETISNYKYVIFVRLISIWNTLIRHGQTGKGGLWQQILLPKLYANPPISPSAARIWREKLHSWGKKLMINIEPAFQACRWISKLKINDRIPDEYKLIRESTLAHLSVSDFNLTARYDPSFTKPCINFPRWFHFSSEKVRTGWSPSPCFLQQMYSQKSGQAQQNAKCGT